MTFAESELIRTKLLALDLRLYEMNIERQRTRVRIAHLEGEIENARLAGLFGEPTPSAADLGPQLKESQELLEGQERVIRTIRNSQKETRLRLVVARHKEAVEARACGE